MPDWNRIFPDADHRWIMGLRRSDSAVDFFADVDATGATRREKAAWLADEPHKYAILLPEAEPALNETIELARAWGANPDAQIDDDPFAGLLRLGRAWEPDFVWMHPATDGLHHLIGGVVCFPSVWALTDKVGRPMSFVHEPVPELNPSIGRQIELFLRNQDPGVVWLRENWSLSRESWLNQHTSRSRRRLDETVGVDDVWFRLEHQLLLKLPQSGSILFGIRVEVVPFRAVVENKLAAPRFARLLSTMSPTAASYKDILTVRPALLKMLTSSPRPSNDDR
ncbi:MAG: heme-dependent oxidative N-demethylase subunit alpha family protein [Planctomycetaceae bacterium]